MALGLHHGWTSAATTPAPVRSGLIAGLWRHERAGQVARAARLAVRMEIVVLVPGREPVTGIADNLSATGFRATIPLDLPVGMLLRVSFRVGRARHARVARIADGQVGCAFVGAMGDAELADLLGAEDAPPS